MTPEGKVSHIAMNVIKSTHRMGQQVVRMTPEGIESEDGMLRDHDYMLVSNEENADGLHEFVQQRQLGMHVMTQIRPSREGQDLVVRWQDQDDLVIPLDRTRGKIVKAKIWDDVVIAVDQGERTANWFSDHLDKKVRLVRAVGPQFHRPARQNYMANSNTLRFQDGYPLHWITQEDVAELEQVAGVEPGEWGWERFRPQFVVEGLPAQYIHSLLQVLIAGVPVLEPKPCGRCPIPTHNQETGVKTPQLSKALLSYKAWLNADNGIDPIFGENGLPQGSGIVRVGSPVEVIELREGGEQLVYGPIAEMRELQVANKN